MLACKEKRIEEVTDNPARIFEIKVDGCRGIYFDGKLFTERKIDRSERFAHIVNILKNHNVVLDGEIYSSSKDKPFGDLFLLNSRKGWSSARYCIFDILELGGEDLTFKPLWERKQILREFVRKLDTSLIHTPISFSRIDLAWNFVNTYNAEGLVSKDLNSVYFRSSDIFEERRTDAWTKIKNIKEEKEEVIGFEKGSVKGSFILKNGSRISSLSPDFEKEYNKLKEAMKNVIAEFTYLNKTPKGAYFQPCLKRLVSE